MHTELPPSALCAEVHWATAVHLRLLIPLVAAHCLCFSISCLLQALLQHLQLQMDAIQNILRSLLVLANSDRPLPAVVVGRR